ncbi:MAG: site-specific DNA-methyltransferase [Candidatus Thorarchaeota archaeon]|jgi:adenine-specific DNA-methyltransferase
MTDRPDSYTLSWPGKDEARGLAYNQSLYTLEADPELSVEFDTAGNLFIEGDNLEVLKLLLPTHEGKIKMIYIDPPYNTGGTFVYSDRHSSHSRASSRQDGIHSGWLSMMFPRLILAQRLLREDGVVLVSIDDKEVHHLRMMMNEVFGEENFVTTIVWEKKFSPQNDARWFSDNHDYILLFACNKERWRPRLLPRTPKTDSRYKNPDNDPRGPWTSSDMSVKTYNMDYDYEITTPSGRRVQPPRGRCWGMPRNSFTALVDDNRVWFGEKGGNVPRLKRFLSDVKPGITPRTIWRRSEVGDNQEARRQIRDIFGDVGVFDTPKPVRLIKRMLHLCTEPNGNDIVLDFFAGSCTTAHAVLELNQEDIGNRQFIMVQSPEEVPKKSRASAAGFRTVSEIGSERLKRVIESIRPEDEAESQDLGFRYLVQVSRIP